MIYQHISITFFFFNDTATTEIYTLSLHDALPIWKARTKPCPGSSSVYGAASDRPLRGSHAARASRTSPAVQRSEEHTSELQSRRDLVCRLLLEKKKKKNNKTTHDSLTKY